MLLPVAQRKCDEDTAIPAFLWLLPGPTSLDHFNSKMSSTLQTRPKSSVTHVCPRLSILNHALIPLQVSLDHFKIQDFFAMHIARLSTSPFVTMGTFLLLAIFSHETSFPSYSLQKTASHFPKILCPNKPRVFASSRLSHFTASCLTQAAPDHR